MKAIETRYCGYRFRSRTEARWAVFFETLGFRWVYEEEGFELPVTGRYLPDFKLTLPDDRIYYCEVQSDGDDDFAPPEMAKLKEFAQESDCRVLHLTGIPDHRAYNQFIPRVGESLTLAFFQDYDPWINTADEYWMQMLEMDDSELTGRMRWIHPEGRLHKSFGRRYVEAVAAARGARFEHGEKPKTRAKALR